MTKLIDDLSAYGVDAKDVLERFVGDEELYRDCLMLFVNDNAFSELGSALECRIILPPLKRLICSRVFAQISVLLFCLKRYAFW